MDSRALISGAIITTSPSYSPSEIPLTTSKVPSQSNFPTMLPTGAPTREIIKEAICLEKDYKYSFSITDSFGDGMCCFEGEGSYEVKVDDIAIKQGGDFGKSENFWFKHKQCKNDSDCDDGAYSTTYTCDSKAATCIYIPKACHEYGEMMQINVTTFNFPESATWSIQDDEGVIQHEGGPYEISKRVFASEKCLPDGLYKVKNTGSDIIGIKLGLGTDGLLINEEYVQSGEDIHFVIGEVPVLPSFVPSTSISPSTPTVDLSCHSCSNNEGALSIDFMTDGKSNIENVVLIESNYNSEWKEKHRLQNLDSNTMNKFNLCFDKHSCHRLVIKDLGLDGICCEHGHGWFNAHWNGMIKDIFRILATSNTNV